MVLNVTDEIKGISSRSLNEKTFGESIIFSIRSHADFWSLKVEAVWRNWSIIDKFLKI